MAVKKYAGMTYDTKTGKFTYPGLTEKKLRAQAAAEINPQFAAQKTALSGQYDQSKLGYLGQQQGVMGAYKQGIGNINEAYKKASENAAQADLSRGMARSSFAANRQDAIGAEKLGALNTALTQKNAQLGDIQNAIANAAVEYRNAMLSLDAQKAQEVFKRMNELRNAEQEKWLDIQKWNRQAK